MSQKNSYAFYIDISSTFLYLFWLSVTPDLSQTKSAASFAEATEVKVLLRQGCGGQRKIRLAKVQNLEPETMNLELKLTTHRSPLIAHTLTLTSHLSPLTSHLSPLTSHHSPLITHLFKPTISVIFSDFSNIWLLSTFNRVNFHIFH